MSKRMRIVLLWISAVIFLPGAYFLGAVLGIFGTNFLVEIFDSNPPAEKLLIYPGYQWLHTILSLIPPIVFLVIAAFSTRRIIRNAEAEALNIESSNPEA